MESVSEPVLLECEVCSKTFKYKKALNSHIQKLHPQPFEHSRSFEIVELNSQDYPSRKSSNNCLQMARSDSDVSLEDKENIEKAQKVKCNHCGKPFQRPGALNKHIHQNHPEVYVSSKTKGISFVCNTCNCGFSYRKTLIRHIQDKHPEEMCADVSSQAYNCPVCSLKFEYYVNLKQHIKRFHPDESPFPKEKNFRHFKCDICKINFLRRYDLTRHKLKEHPSGVVKEMIDSKRFACNFCPKRFSYKFNMHLHSVKKHPNEWNSLKEKKAGSICCAHCGKWYSSKMSITNHMRQKHPSTIKPSGREIREELQIVNQVESYKNNRGHRFCPLCSASFMSKEAIYKHFRTQHGKKIETHLIDVENEVAFHEWKRQFEIDTQCKFVKYNNYKSKKEIVKILICHRSGCFQSRSRGFRHLRLTGSEKINGFCPAEVRFVHNFTNNQCSVYYIDEHIGHGQELQFLKLEEPSKMLKLDSVLDFSLELDEPCSQPKQNLDDKHLFDTIVLSSWISENEDSVLYIKGPEERDPEFPELNTGPDGDFVFIIMNEFQATMFNEYASDIVAVSRMEGPNDYDLELFVVMVVDNYRQGIPCCMMLSNRSDQCVYELLFTKLGGRAGRIKPSVFMSDMQETYVNAWKATMPRPDRQLFCSWYVKRCWEKNLTRIECPSKRKEIRQFLNEIRMELNPFRFHELLQQLINMKDKELNSFLEYFCQNFVKNESTWAYCYRKYAGINTNYVCDRFFRSLRHLYLRDRSTFSLEQILDALTLLLKSLPLEKLIREVKGKLVSKIKEARIRHSTVAKWPEEHLNAINHVSDNKWFVPSSNGDEKEEIYHVERVLAQCDCKLLCRECRSCLHQYRCSCLDNCIQFNMCVHIHAVCILQNKINAIVDDSDLIEEFEVDVVQDILFVNATDNAIMYSEIENDEDFFFLPIEDG